MRYLSAPLVAVPLLASPLQAREPQWQEFAANGPWSLDYAEESCALQRNFSDGERSVFLEMRQFTPFSPLRITLASAEVDVERSHLEYRFGTDREFRSHDLPAYVSYGEGVEGVSFYGSLLTDGEFEGMDTAERDNLSPAEATALYDRLEADIADLYLDEAFDDPIVLQTGALAGPMSALRDCVADLVNSWNAGPYLDDLGARKPKPVDFARWSRPLQRYYLSGALDRKKPLVVRVRLLLDENAAITGCLVQEPVVLPAYQDFVCDHLVKEARYEPARDGNGNAIASYYLLGIAYMPS